MKGFEKFLPKSQLEGKVGDWRDFAQVEGTNPVYEFDRPDSGVNSVDEAHGISFIEEVIPRLIKSKKKGEKVRILDVGAGAAFFSDKLRKAFPDDVKVFSTGLSKKNALEYRKLNRPEGEEKLHPDDLKWHSILELSDFEEFDLITDTYGEFIYAVQNAGLKLQDRALEYLNALIKKLKPGGLASIAPLRGVIISLGPQSSYVLQRLERQYNVKITQERNSKALRIEKNK